jgi:hypothetical protein
MILDQDIHLIILMSSKKYKEFRKIIEIYI